MCAFDDCLSAEAGEKTGEFTDGAACACDQPNVKWVEDCSHGVNDRNARRGNKDRCVGKQCHKEDAEITVLFELLHVVANGDNVGSDCDDDNQGK